MRLPVIALLLLCLIARAGVAPAQTTIHHCVAGDGTPVFTDQPCSSLGATSVTPAAPGAPGHASSGISFALIGCPADTQQLKSRISQAFAAHDANALAGLMLWHGYGRAAVHSYLRRLRALVDEPLMGIDGGSPPPAREPSTVAFDGMDMYTEAQDDPAAETSVPAPRVPDTLVLHLGGVGDDASHNPKFGVRVVADCVWLSP